MGIIAAQFRYSAGEDLAEQRLGFVILAAHAKQHRQVVRRGERLAVVGSPDEPSALQRRAEERLGLGQPPLVLQEGRQIVGRLECLRVAFAEATAAEFQGTPQVRLGLVELAELSVGAADHQADRGLHLGLVGESPGDRRAGQIQRLLNGHAAAARVLLGGRLREDVIEQEADDGPGLGRLLLGLEPPSLGLAPLPCRRRKAAEQSHD